MVHTQSPWLYELKKKRKPYTLQLPFPTTDVTIIGGGIAGISTAYYILTQTHKNVILLEKNVIASGATGHNAGQIVTYFERPIAEIIRQYGSKLAIEGQLAINSGWDLLEEIQKTVSLQTPIHIFAGLSGCVSYKSVIEHLENRYDRPEISHQKEFCFIADDCMFLSKIPGKFSDLYTILPRKIILDLLETRDTNYSVAFTSKKGCMNSAAFSEEVANYLLRKYANRFQIAENMHVSELLLKKHNADIILNDTYTLTSAKIILCTNGFKDIKIRNKAGKAISNEYHEALRGKQGFMKAYTFVDDKKPTAVSYYNTDDKPYFYLTRRPSPFSRDNTYNLVAVGGPEYFLADKTTYRQESVYPEEIRKQIDFFMQWTLMNAFRKRYEHIFLWHGIMGYTKNGIRLIGPDKYNPVLLYNLGCNGVGILPSIFGGKKIAQFLNNQVYTKSIFDPYI
ncbi:MAG TPA: FAD-binding oxidoreductase [Candidatus Saccharimonadales bacterium]|nr:FAD-binding oxidoreductase [Candidatus Saccharimonadales bacterium]